MVESPVVVLVVAMLVVAALVAGLIQQVFACSLCSHFIVSVQPVDIFVDSLG